MTKQFAELGPLPLELGGRLPAVRLAYQTWGLPRRRSGRIVNAVLVLHALTGDAHVVGPAGPDQPTPGWWDGLIGPGLALDPDQVYVVAANVLGGCQGSTGPASTAPDGRPWGSRFPRITVRDQVAAEVRLADFLGLDRLVVIGGSMGGMRALEWLAGRPERVSAGLALATSAAASADQIGTQSTQIAAITADPAWRGGDYHAGPAPVGGLGVARRIAHLTYRSAGELDTRFGRSPQAGEDPYADGRFAVQSYLDHQAAKLVRRFDAGSYVCLTDAMNTHDLGRGRGGLAAVLTRLETPLIAGAISTDRLYPVRLMQEIAELAPGCEHFEVIESPYGHDGFLIEIDAVSALVRRTLARAGVSGQPVSC